MAATFHLNLEPFVALLGNEVTAGVVGVSFNIFELTEFSFQVPLYEIYCPLLDRYL